MRTETSPYGATEYRDVLARLALQRANIMHFVDLKRGGTPRGAQKCGSAASPIGHSRRLTLSRLGARPSSIEVPPPAVPAAMAVPVVVVPAVSCPQNLFGRPHRSPFCGRPRTLQHCCPRFRFAGPSYLSARTSSCPAFRLASSSSAWSASYPAFRPASWAASASTTGAEAGAADQRGGERVGFLNVAIRSAKNFLTSMVVPSSSVRNP